MLFDKKPTKKKKTNTKSQDGIIYYRKKEKRTNAWLMKKFDVDSIFINATLKDS